MASKEPKPGYFVPTPKQSADKTRVYGHIETMRQLKDRDMPHFQTGPEGRRSFNRWIDDSERILNGYTLSREDQGKEEWQSNLLDNITRSKLRAIAAGVGLKVPEMAITATNDSGMQSAKRADIVKNTTKQTYADDNPTLYAFRQVWHMLGHGVVFEYEGYKTGGAMQEVVDSFDSFSGEVKTHKEYRKMDGKPFSVIINPQEFLWWTFFVEDVQDQPRVAWIQHYTKRELELEFSKFPNYKYVLSKSEAGNLKNLLGTAYFEKWADNVSDEDDYEVIRYFSKADEGSEDGYGYEIWANGVPLLQCPLLWGEKEKVYPFAKSISEPFANTNFFVGMTFPALMEHYQDGKNTTINTLIDKMWRSVDPLKLVGLGNRDLLDWEAGTVTQDNTIYVPDINAVKFMEHPGVNQGELAMLQVLNQGIESSSISMTQQGANSQVQKTAKQAQLEDVRAREIKGILYMFLEDLWLQKTRLRTQIILTSYLKDKASQESQRGRIITIKDYSFADGSRGILDIYVAKKKSDMLSQQEIEAREQAMEEQGIAYKLISMSVDYLNDWKYDIKIEPQTFHNQDKLAKKEELMGEIETVTTLFPEFFVANKDKYLKEVLALNGKHPDQFAPPAQVPPPMPGMGQEMPPGGPQASPMQPGQSSSVLGLPNA